jgi:hypothetical protein
MEKTSQKNIKTERFVLSMAQSDLVAQDSRSASTRNPQPVVDIKECVIRINTVII